MLLKQMVPAAGLSPGAIYRRRPTWPVPDIRANDDNDLYFSRVKMLHCGFFNHVVRGWRKYRRVEYFLNAIPLARSLKMLYL